MKLDALRERLSADVPVITADVNDPASIRRLADATKVVITTVGPYSNYGEPLVAACAAAGTHYVDLTGEPEFVDLMWLRHQQEAQRSGAKLVHSCGFDSIPYDLGALFTVGQLPEGVPIKLEGFVRGTAPSPAALHSAVHVMSRLRQGRRAAQAYGASSAGRHHPRRHRGAPPRRDRRRLISPHDRPAQRSGSRAGPLHPDFSHTHYIVTKPPVAAGLVAGVGTVAALAHLTRARCCCPSRTPATAHFEERAKAWFKIAFVGEGGGRRVVTEVSGGDPGYSETSKMLAESALCSAHDDLPDHARGGHGPGAHRPTRRRRHRVRHGV